MTKNYKVDIAYLNELNYYDIKHKKMTPYLQGVYNGMEFCLSILEDREFKPIEPIPKPPFYRLKRLIAIIKESMNPFRAGFTRLIHSKAEAKVVLDYAILKANKSYFEKAQEIHEESLQAVGKGKDMPSPSRMRHNRN